MRRGRSCSHLCVHDRKNRETDGHGQFMDAIPGKDVLKQLTALKQLPGNLHGEFLPCS